MRRSMLWHKATHTTSFRYAISRFPIRRHGMAGNQAAAMPLGPVSLIWLLTAPCVEIVMGALARKALIRDVPPDAQMAAPFDGLLQLENQIIGGATDVARTGARMVSGLPSMAAGDRALDQTPLSRRQTHHLSWHPRSGHGARLGAIDRLPADYHPLPNRNSPSWAGLDVSLLSTLRSFGRDQRRAV